MNIHLLLDKKTNYIDETLLESTSTFDDITLKDDIKDCDFILLPYTWEHYYQNRQVDKLKEILEIAKKDNKQIIGLTYGDFGYTPLDKDAVLLKNGGVKSRKVTNQIEAPYFIEDPLIKYYDGIPSYRSKQENIKVGFCGKVNNNPLNEIYDTLELVKIWSSYKLSKLSKEPIPVFPTSNRLRNTVLKSCNHPKIETDFVLRKKFMNGLRGQSNDVIDKHKSTFEFFNNIRNSDYTLCMRGVGNFSIRFFQTLAMGRIPVFINTDCILPFEEIIDWKKILPWVEYSDLDRLPEILLEYHNQLSNDDFLDRQKMMREIWEKYLSHAGFFNHFGSYIETFANNK